MAGNREQGRPACQKLNRPGATGCANTHESNRRAERCQIARSGLRRKSEGKNWEFYPRLLIIQLRAHVDPFSVHHLDILRGNAQFST
jgi:hypothetical protein